VIRLEASTATISGLALLRDPAELQCKALQLSVDAARPKRKLDNIRKAQQAQAAKAAAHARKSVLVVEDSEVAV
jgi:hypothetical protein